MADKTIGELTQATALNDDSLLIAEQNGEAVSVPGSLFKEFAKQGVDAYVTAAQEAADRAEQAAKDAQAAADAVVDVTEDAEAAAAAAQAAQDAQAAAETARQAAEDAAALAAEQVATEVESKLQGYVDDAEQAKADAETAAENAATDAVAEVDTKMADYVSAAQAAQAAAEQARDEAQAVAGGDFLSKAGGTLTGALTLAGDPTEDLHAVPKQYVDNAVQNLDLDVTADEVTFEDGETFQQKYDNGELKGEKGDTPVKGTDYFTDEDKTELVNAVLANFTDVSEVGA